MTDESVPDERGSAGEAVFWAAVLVTGLAAFLYDFVRIVLRSVPEAEPIAIVHGFQRTMFSIAILGGGVTVALVAYAVYAFGAGRRPSPAVPDVDRSRFMLAVFALGMTFLMVTTMFVGASTLARTDEASAASAAERTDVDRRLGVDVTASQWFWRFDVEGVPTTQGERVVLPAGTVVELEITSADVIHSFAVQELGLKKDAFPGETNTAWFRVESVEGETSVEAGDERIDADSYTVTCAELCGKGHSKMTATMYVVAPEDYEHWVEVKNGTVPASFHAEEDEADEGGHDDDGH